MFRRLLALIAKEMQSIFRNKQSRMLLIMPVLIQTIVFPFAATLEVKNNTVLVYNEDTGYYSKELIQRFSHSSSFSNIIYAHNEVEFNRYLENQDAIVGIKFLNTFSTKLLQKNGAPLQVILDGRRSNSSQIALSYVQSITSNFLRDNHFPSLPEISTRNIYNPNLNYQWHILPSLVAIITTIGCLVVSALSVAREREEGTFDQLLVSPLTPIYIMIGKAVPGILVALIQSTLIVIAAVYFYQMPFTGNLFVLYISIILYGLSLVGFGLFISSFCQTQQQASLGVFCFMVPAVILSGYVSPIENMPLLLRIVSYINPLSHFIIILKGLYLKNYGISLALKNMWQMVLISALTLTLAYRMFKRHIA